MNKNEIKNTTKTSFVNVMGSSPTNRVLDFLIENDRENWTMVEISRNANVGYSTLKIVLPQLIKTRLILIKKIIGKTKLYAINKENPVVKKIYDLYNQINLVRIKNL